MIKNLVFSASGSKIFIHLGFLKYLSENNLLDNVETLIGTSGGAIMALVISLGYKLETITELFLKLDSDKLKKIDSESVLNFFDNYGLDDGANLERALRIILKSKYNSDHITFDELFKSYKKKLVICAANLQTHDEVYFNYENTPTLDVVTAVLMSLAIPIMFTPKMYDGDMYVDGGIICPYPIDYIAHDKSVLREETLGILMAPEYTICKDNFNYEFVFCNKEFKKRVEIDSFEKYLFSVLSCGSIRLLKERYELYKDITVLVVNNNNGLIFEVDREMRENYIIEGYKYTSEFFKMRYKKNVAETINYDVEVKLNNLEANDLEANDLEANDLEANDLEANNLEANDLEANELEANDLEANIVN